MGIHRSLAMRQVDVYKRQGQAHVKQGAVLRFIEKLNAYPYEKNKGLVGGILVLTIICLFTSQNVRFNEDMMGLNYEPAHLKQSENKLAELFDKNEKTVLFVSTCLLYTSPTSSVSGSFSMASIKQGISEAKCCPSESMVMA